MSIGFRKSLFGFNCYDVMEYIDKIQSEYAESKKQLTDMCEELRVSLDKKNTENEKLVADNNALTSTVNEYNEKKAEIERMSENIGKLYLVAQTNAKAIIKNAQESADASNAEVGKNISAIDTAHESLDALRRRITEISDDFNSKADELMSALSKTKDMLQENSQNSESASEEFNRVYESVVK